MKTPSLASHKLCTGCGACAAVCQLEAIIVEHESDGHYYPHIDSSICVGCLQCEKVCPIQGAFKYGCNSMNSTPLKAWNTNYAQRQRSSSGGVFSALATWFIENGGYVSGAIIDKLQIKHIVSSKIEDIRRMQGSKYLQSETVEAFKRILELLPDNKVLFSGTGCQVAGLICLVSKKNTKLLDNLFTIDIVCDGVPSYRLLEKTVDSLNNDNVSIFSFRNKTKGWSKTPKELTLMVDGEKRCIGEHNLMIQGFNKSLTSRYSCYDCKYAFTDRKSDITIADFWGLQNESDENLFNGVSLVLVHSSKGRQALASSNIHFSSVSWPEATRSNFRVYYGEKRGFADTWLHRNIGYLFDHFSYKNLLCLYGVTPKSRYDILGRIVHLWYQRKIEKVKKEINKHKLV